MLEDHGLVGGLADHVLRTLANANAVDARRVVTFAVEGYPACGMPTKALKFHGLDGASLASRILQQLNEA